MSDLRQKTLEFCHPERSEVPCFKKYRILTAFEMTRITNGFCHPERSEGSL